MRCALRDCRRDRAASAQLFQSGERPAILEPAIRKIVSQVPIRDGPRFAVAKKLLRTDQGSHEDTPYFDGRIGACIAPCFSGPCLGRSADSRAE